MKLKQVISTEFKDISKLDDFKGTLSSLDNLFVGSIFLAFVLLIIYLPGIFLIPVGYIVLTYIGRLIKTLITNFKNKTNESPRP